MRKGEQAYLEKSFSVGSIQVWNLAVQAIICTLAHYSLSILPQGINFPDLWVGPRGPTQRCSRLHRLNSWWRHKETCWQVSGLTWGKGTNVPFLWEACGSCLTIKSSYLILCITPVAIWLPLHLQWPGLGCPCLKAIHLVKQISPIPPPQSAKWEIIPQPSFQGYDKDYNYRMCAKCGTLESCYHVIML